MELLRGLVGGECLVTFIPAVVERLFRRSVSLVSINYPGITPACIMSVIKKKLMLNFIKLPKITPA